MEPYSIAKPYVPTESCSTSGCTVPAVVAVYVTDGGDDGRIILSCWYHASPRKIGTLIGDDLVMARRPLAHLVREGNFPA